VLPGSRAASWARLRLARFDRSACRNVVLGCTSVMCKLRLIACQALAISKRLFVATVNREAFCRKVFRGCRFLPWRSLALNIYFICACTGQSAAPVEHRWRQRWRAAEPRQRQRSRRRTAAAAWRPVCAGAGAGDFRIAQLRAQNATFVYTVHLSSEADFVQRSACQCHPCLKSRLYIDAVFLSHNSVPASCGIPHSTARIQSCRNRVLAAGGRQ